MGSEYRSMAFSLETERLTLQPRRQSDADWNLELMGEHEGDTALTLDEAQRRLARQEATARDSGIGLLTIKRRAEGDSIRYCGQCRSRCRFRDGTASTVVHSAIMECSILQGAREDRLSPRPQRG